MKGVTEALVSSEVFQLNLSRLQSLDSHKLSVSQKYTCFVTVWKKTTNLKIHHKRSCSKLKAHNVLVRSMALL